MPMIDDARVTLQRLSDSGWRPILDRLGIDPAGADLRQALLRPVPDQSAIRQVPGFEEAARDAVRSVAPGDPARSLLYHALASPAVRFAPDGRALGAFPTPAELDLFENLVFGIEAPALEDILASFPGASIAIAVFGREYRQRRGTVHGAHADMVYSRTGVTRVGTLAAHWDGASRSFLPRIGDDDLHAIRVMPCRYAVYLAVQRLGDPNDFGPYKADRTFRAAQRFGTTPQTDRLDSAHEFWVPVHKLFSGPECLRGRDLSVAFEASHVNEKLRRIHAKNMGVPRSQMAPGQTFDSGFGEPEISRPPFTVTTGLADFSGAAEDGPGVLAAFVRPRLIEPADLDSEPIGTRVPRRRSLSASFTIPGDRVQSLPGFRAHRAPEWMHVRTHLRANGTEQDLNLSQNVVEVVESGRVGNSDPYVARHYSDFTGDGWLAASVTGVPIPLTRLVPAYSLIAAPDFYPFVSQSELIDWALDVLPSNFGRRIWEVPPLTLCDQRDAPNLALRRFGAPFVAEDKTVTAIVGQAGSVTGVQSGSTVQFQRTSYLSDNAAGIYAPGWDTSIDFDPVGQAKHLAAHGLGSPFPEDAKLCAALSAFWPAVAPDTSRSYERAIVSPMTDREIGLEDAPPWDGVPGLRLVQVNGQPHVEVDDFAHVDYVRTALEGRFTMAETMKVSQSEYQARIIATQRMFDALTDEGLSEDNPLHRMLSFIQAGQVDPDRVAAEAAHFALIDPAYKFVMVETSGSRPLERHEDDPARWLRRSRINLFYTIFVDDGGKILFRIDDGPWQTPPTV